MDILQRSLAERLAEMEKRSGTFAGDIRVISNAANRTTTIDDERSLVPKAGSLQTLLTQALHTNDDALFEYCLSSSMAGTNIQHTATINNGNLQTNIPQILQSTIQRLPSPYIIPLLSRLTSLLHSRPSRALPLLTWIHALLLTHTPYLLSQPPQSLTSPFSSLMSLLEHRVASYKKMCRLQGKLEVMMAQIAAADNNNQATNKIHKLGRSPMDSFLLKNISGPLSVYTEGIGQQHNNTDNGITSPTLTSTSTSTSATSNKKRRRRRGGGGGSVHHHTTSTETDDHEKNDDIVDDVNEEDRDPHGMDTVNNNGLFDDFDDEDDGDED